MELYEIIPGKLYQSPAIDDWTPLRNAGIALVNDLSDIDPNIPNDIVYGHCPIVDGPLPDLPHLETMHSWAEDSAQLINTYAWKILSHCGAGINRASLMNGLILWHLDYKGQKIIDTIRAGRPGALSNQNFVNYLLSL